MTSPDDVPQSYVDLVRDLLMDRAGYSSDNCPDAVREKFEATARIACVIIVDEERKRAQTQKD